MLGEGRLPASMAALPGRVHVCEDDNAPLPFAIKEHGNRRRYATEEERRAARLETYRNFRERNKAARNEASKKIMQRLRAGK